MWWHTPQKPDFVFRQNGEVHLNRPGGGGRQFSRLLTAEVCASAVVMLDKPCSEVVWRVLATHCIRQFPLHSPLVRHHVTSHFNWSLPSTACFCTLTRPYPITLIPIGSGYFRGKHFPVQITPTLLKTSQSSYLHTYEDGTVLRNVGI